MYATPIEAIVEYHAQQTDLLTTKLSKVLKRDLSVEIRRLTIAIDPNAWHYVASYTPEEYHQLYPDHLRHGSPTAYHRYTTGTFTDDVIELPDGTYVIGMSDIPSI
mgnify:CR=1 FL=1